MKDTIRLKRTLTTEAMIADAPAEKGGGMDMGGMGGGMGGMGMGM